MLNAWTNADPCCETGLRSALDCNTLMSGMPWTCTACGMEWRGTVIGAVVYWEPFPYVELI